MITGNAHALKHGMSNTQAYHSWRCMKYRCDNPNYGGYKNYGGRGITYSPEWANFMNFISDMGNPPGELFTIDRIDTNKGYSKENCKWSTKTEQQLNKRQVVVLGSNTYRGVSRNSGGNFRAKFQNKTVGIFNNEIDAARAYDKSAKKFYGDLAVINGV